MVNPMNIYINLLAEEFRKNFEKKTGKTIGYGTDFDVTEVINFYGGEVEYADLYEEVYKLKGIILKISGEKDFKIIVDKKRSEKLKKRNNDWNMELLKLFYHVIINDEKMKTMNDGDIIYPSVNYVKEALLYRELLDNNDFTNDQASRYASIAISTSNTENIDYIKQLKKRM